MVPMKHPPQEARGFSLLELLSVVVILGLLAGLTIPPLLKNRRQEQLRAFTTGLALWFLEVRTAALKGSSCEVLIPGGMIAEAGVVARIGNVPIPETCSIPDNPYLLPEPASNQSYEIRVTSNGEPVNRFSFTSRGGKFPGSDLLVTIAMADDGPVSCIQLNGLLGSLEIGYVDNDGCVLRRF